MSWIWRPLLTESTPKHCNVYADRFSNFRVRLTWLVRRPRLTLYEYTYILWQFVGTTLGISAAPISWYCVENNTYDIVLCHLELPFRNSARLITFWCGFICCAVKYRASEITYKRSTTCGRTCISCCIWVRRIQMTSLRLNSMSIKR